MRSLPRVFALSTAAVLALAGAAGCGDNSKSSDGKLKVVAAFYPLQFVAERVGGPHTAVTNLVKPGAEPHDLELSPKQAAELSDAGLALYIRGFQPAVDKAVDEHVKNKAFDAATVGPLRDAKHDEGEHGKEKEKDHGGKGGGEEPKKDPHIWLDPTRLAAVADKVAERLGAADSKNAADYKSRAATLRADLTKLDQEYAAGLGTCKTREIVTSHEAFGYLAEKYKLTEVGITGISPEAEPTPQKLAEVTKLVKEHGTKVIFFEPLVSKKVVDTVAKETGAKVEVLDPIEGLQEGSKDDYLSVMRANLGKLRMALECS